MFESLRREILHQKQIHIDSKGQLGGATQDAIGFGIFIIVVAVVAIILQEFRDTQVNIVNASIRSAAYNVSDAGLVALLTWSNFFTIIAVAIVAGVVIFILFRVFGARGVGRA